MPGKSVPIGATTSKTPMPWFTSSTAQTVEGWKKVVRTASWEMVVLQLGKCEDFGKTNSHSTCHNDGVYSHIYIYTICKLFVELFHFLGFEQIKKHECSQALSCRGCW